MVIASVTWVRLCWTFAAALGFVVTTILLSMSITDYKLLKKKGLNSWRQYVAKTSILIFVGGFGTQAIYLSAGIVSLIYGPRSEHITTSQAVDGVLFIFGALTSIALAIIIFYRRQKILWVIEQTLESKESKESKEK